MKVAKNMLINIFAFVFIYLTVGCIKPPEFKGYIIEVTYCDARPKKIVYIEQHYYPTSQDILTGRYYPTPEYYNELNVCEIKVLKELKLKTK